MIRHAMTLIELMIVIAMLAILAALVVPKYNEVTAESGETAASSQLAVVRTQIEVYRANNAGLYPDLITKQWSPLVDAGLLRAAPSNPLNESTKIVDKASSGGGWVWRDKGGGVMEIYLTDGTKVAEFVE